MKIICFLPNYIGDVLMTTPALRLLKKYTNAEIYVVAKTLLKEILEDNPNVNGIIEKNRRIDIIRKIFQIKADYTILFRTTFSNSIVSFLTSPKYSIGINEEMSFLFLKKSVKKDITRPYRSECLFLVEQLFKYLKIDFVLDTLELKKLDFFGWNSEEIKTSVQQKLDEIKIDKEKKIITISPLASRETKILTSKQYIHLIDLLYERYSNNYEIILVANHENYLIKDIILNCRQKIKFLINKTNLKELGYLFSLSSLVISPDSGPAYISESVGTKTIIYFTSTVPEKYGPYSTNVKFIYNPVICSPCYKDFCYNESYNCIKKFRIEDILEIVEKLI